MSKDISKPGTLFEYNGKLHEVISNATEKVVWIKPVRYDDFDKCECGRVLPNQQHGHVLYSPNLQNGIGKVYKAEKEGSQND